MKIKLSSLEKYFDILELLFNTLPYVFWKDTNGKYLGSNLNQAINMGFSSPADFIGKTIYEILPDYDSAKLIDETDTTVISEDKTLITEEKIISPQGKKFYLSQKSPIHDEDGKIIGLLGFAMDITEIKQQEELINERDKLINIAAQVAHDIRSPAASVLMLAKSCQNIPEKERIALREAAMSIQDIANNLLNQYKRKDLEIPPYKEKPENILISALILQSLAEKKLQFLDLPIKIDYEFSQNGYFAFTKIDSSALKRALSNIINNAADSFDGKPGKITVKLDSNSKRIKIIVEDNGKGMTPDLVKQLLNNVGITKGKKHGYGIGLIQVRDALRENQGKLSIDSEAGKGTRINITFSKHAAPPWFAEEIRLNSDDLVIILDDDTSIHGAWDTRFKKIIKTNPSLHLKHFTNGKEVLDFIEDFDDLEKRNIFLLTDYELLKQEINGLQVVAQSQVRRSILVTSHYANPLVRNQAAKTGTKILPKEMASEILIKINEIIDDKKENETLRTVDLIIVDDDEKFVQSLILFAFRDKKVAQYNDPYIFLKEVSKFSKDTKICLDNNFNSCDLHGVEIAGELNIQGYNRLYLLSGESFHDNEVPDYLKVISKDDIDSIKALATDQLKNDNR